MSEEEIQGNARSKNPNGGKKASANSKSPKGKKMKAGPAPAVVEFTLTASIIFLILFNIAIAIISYLSGATPMDIVLRMIVATIIIGFLLVFILLIVSTPYKKEIQEVSTRNELDSIDGNPEIFYSRK